MFSIPRTKEVRTNNKCDLRALWEEAVSPKSSPKPVLQRKPSNQIEAINILSLISNSNGSKNSSPKKLFVPPIMQVKTEIKKIDEIGRDEAILYSNFTVTVDNELSLSEELKNGVTFGYKGADNQLEAWNDFKKHANDTKCSVAAAARFAFIFSNGKVSAKAFTGTAQKLLKEKSKDLNDFDFQEALKLIDDIQESEKLSLYSTEQFYYSVVYPIIVKTTEFESVNGKRYRTSFSGYLFPFQIQELKDLQKDFESFKVAYNVIY